MSHSHDHSHHHAPKKFTSAFAVAVGFNLLFVVIEAFYALTAHSTSLLADAGHNLGDVLGLIMSWAAMQLLATKATEKYSYGFKRTTILAALFNALILLATTGLIIYESIDKLIHPVAVNEVTVMIIAAIGIAINGGTALLFMKGQDDLNIKSAFLHLAYDALISLGVVIAGGLILWLGWQWLDPLVGLFIAAIILFGTWGLLRKSIDLILDAVPHNVSRDAVESYLSAVPDIQALHHLHIWSLSTQDIAMTVHLIAKNGISDQQMHTIHHDLAQHFQINHATIQVEKGDDCHDACQ
ncbi:MAG: cation transporter [Gammaproteobacteria bacterium]|nr:cation transporter [Gammaproteobacteria bacterium]